MVTADPFAPGYRPRSRRSGRCGTVVSYAVGGCANPPGHEDVTRGRIASRLAALLDFEAGGEYAAQRHADAGPLYFVPSITLTRAHAEGELGISREDQLFGGIVPHRYVATKTITHGLLGAESAAPRGWSPTFGLRVKDAVLTGYSAFAVEDARSAALLLLERGPVRVKRAGETGGHGQFVISTERELDALLAQLEPVDIERDGVVLEENLDSVRTLSVGQVSVGELRVSYYGTQQLTEDHTGAPVYGGSSLFVVRGDYDALLPRAPDGAVRTAIEQARCYEAAALACFAGFCASRRNYDIAQGLDACGRLRSGVLEQSWRIGGASCAEMVALEALAAEPGLAAVHAACTETYSGGELPRDATVYYDGEDPRVGRIAKYATVRPA